jgi:transposase-like protein
MNVIDLIVVRQVQYLNTIIEQDHRAIELVTSRCSTQSVPVGRLRAGRRSCT